MLKMFNILLCSLYVFYRIYKLMLKRGKNLDDFDYMLMWVFYGR